MQWRDQRKLSIEWLKKLGMVRFGLQRDIMESRIMNGINDLVQNVLNEIKVSYKMDPFHILHHSVGNVLNEIVFGIKYDKDDETWKYLQHLQEEGVKYIGVSGAVNFLPFLRHLPSNRKIINFLLDGKQKTHKIYDHIIQQCQSTIQSSTDSILKNFLIEKEKRLSSNDKGIKYCSDEQLRHVLADLFGAGVDTTLTTIRWFILYTAKDETIQNKLREEISSVLENMAPKLDDYDRLPYMRATIAEAQRIRSVTPLGIPHGLTTDTEINGFKIPKGTMVVPLLWAVHMNEKNWIDPEIFDPTRFLNHDGVYETPPNFIPFQTGTS